MPIIKPSNITAPVFYPKTDYNIAKYLDLTKFISLINEKALFFCRLDKLEDKFEGTGTAHSYEMWFRTFDDIRKKGFLNVELTDADINKKVEEQLELQNKLKGLTCVSCWNRANKESAALWKIYSGFSNGFMIKSSIYKLIESFKSSNEEIQLSEINYLDYNKDHFPDLHKYYPFIHKRDAYSYEEEVRLIAIKNPESGYDYDWEKEKVQAGFYVSCDLNILIDEIVISPFSENWFYELVQDILTMYKMDDLKEKLRKSNLS